MEPPHSNYLLLNRQRRHPIDRRDLHNFLSSLISELGLAGRCFSVVLIADDRMRSYNRNYRGQDRPADVLSFPGENGYLGDILISPETAYRRARKSSTPDFQKSIKRLLLHGLLHLMGYDHETDRGEMNAFERRLRRKCQC